MGPRAPSTKVAARRNHSPSTAAGVWEHFPMGGNSVTGRIPPQQQSTDGRICHRKTQSRTRMTRNRRYRKKRNNDVGEIRQRNPYGRQPTWEDLHHEVNAFREHINYDSDQEEASAQATIRKRKHTSYEKRQEMRRREKA